MSLHIEVAGRGPPLVLLHGWALHGGVFAPLVERLSSRFEFHLVDLPGHGCSRDSGVPLALDACIAEIAARTPPAVWLGWSLGGLFALKAAVVSPGVRGLVMLAATPRFVKGADWPDAVEREVFEQFGIELQQDYRWMLDRFLALDTIGSEHARAELRKLRETLYARGEPAPRALQDGLRLLERTDLRHLLPSVNVPGLWISGRRDRLVQAESVRIAAERTPLGEHVDIAGGGHAPFIGHADIVADRIATFMDGIRDPEFGIG
jgi:pimeloyl-[acyl-carrier protein] methyl ester esterase